MNVAAGEWRPVSEPPDPDNMPQYVLLWLERDGPVLGEPATELHDFTWQRFIEGEEHCEADNVTHWAPISPPEDV